MRTVTKRAATALAVSGLGLLLLGGCGQQEGPDAATYLNKAAEYDEAGRHRARVLALKNALQQEPRNPEARRRLGEAYLELGNPQGAEEELRRARELGAPAGTVRLSLARSLLQQGKHEAVLAELKGLDSLEEERQAKALAIRGLAHLVAGKPDPAEAAFERALEKDPGLLEARTGRIRVHMARQDTDRAREALNTLLKERPDSHEGWRLMGHLERLAGRPKQAEAAFTMAIAHSDRPLEDYLDRALVRIFLGDLEGVEGDLKAARAENDKHPRVSLVQGLLHLKRQEYGQAQTQLERATGATRDVNVGTFYLGMAHYAQEQWHQARQHLDRFLQSHPRSQQARVLLASLALRDEAYDRAERLLRPAAEAEKADARVLGLLGRVKMAQGKPQEGAALLRRAQRGQRGAAGTAVGLTLLSHGQTGLGIEELELALKDRPEDSRASLGLALGYLGQGKLDQAYEAAKRVKEARPDSPAGPNFMALALLGQGKAERAFALLERVQEGTPGDPMSGLLLAGRARREGDAARAEALYRAILDHHPDQQQALLRLAHMEEGDGNGQQARKLLRRAVEAAPGAVRPRRALARHHLRRGEPAEAMEVVEQGLKQAPDSRALAELKGHAQLAMGRPSSAVTTFRDLAERSPEAAGPRFLLGQAYLQAGRADKARGELEAAVDLDPALTPARMVLARLLLRQDRMERAGEVIEGLRADHPRAPAVLDLAGELAFREGRPAEAAEIYAKAQAERPATRFVTRRAEAQWADGARQEAVATLEQWLREHPEETTARLILAQRYQALGRRDEAIGTYRALLEEAPDSVVVRNNLAWLLRERDPDAAMDHARRARELAPDSPEVLDTYGMLLLGRGEQEEATRALRKAVEGRPGSPTLRYHLARALAEDGDPDEAREHLASILDGGRTFPERARARALMERLGR